MNAPTHERWSDLDLELYHDGELPDAPRAELNESLRHSPALRARLSRITSVDAVASRALAAPGPVARTRWWPAAVGFAAAACLVLVAATALYIRPGAPPEAAPAPSLIASQPAPRPSAARVVLSLPITRPAAADPARGTPVAPALDAPLADAPPPPRAAPERDAEFRRLGELIRSAARAEELLDSLPAEAQLAACRVWAEDPRLRPFAFARLDRLATHAELADQYRAVLTHFSSRPDLNGWVRSYLHAEPSERPVLKSS